MPSPVRSDRARLLDEMFGRSRGPDWIRSRLLRTGEVAVLFQVSRRTVNDWARTGKLSYVMTPGGQRRYPSAAVAGLLSAMDDPATDDTQKGRLQ